MSNSFELGSNLQKMKVVSESVGDGGRSIRFSFPHPHKIDQEGAYFEMKDFGKFVYFSSMHADNDLRGKGVARAFIDKAQAYLDEHNKFGFVSNQISRMNGARYMYRAPEWFPLSEHNWMIRIPKALRNPENPLAVPLLDTELNEMVRICMKN